MKLSRIRVTNGGTFGTILRVVFVAIILSAVAFGFARKAEAQIMTPRDRYDDPVGQHLFEAGVNFVYFRGTDTYVIMRGGKPPTFVEGYTTPAEVCDALRAVRLPHQVLFSDSSGVRGSVCK